MNRRWTEFSPPIEYFFPRSKLPTLKCLKSPKPNFAGRTTIALFRSDEGMTTRIVDLRHSERTVHVIFLPLNVCLTLDQQHDRGAPTESPRVKCIDGLIVPDNSPKESGEVCMPIQAIRSDEPRLYKTAGSRFFPCELRRTIQPVSVEPCPIRDNRIRPDLSSNLHQLPSKLGRIVGDLASVRFDRLLLVRLRERIDTDEPACDGKESRDALHARHFSPCARWVASANEQAAPRMNSFGAGCGQTLFYL
jgi:hypothetical protein